MADMCIGVDWGTTHVRAFLLRRGKILETKRFVSSLQNGEGTYYDILNTEIGSWMEEHNTAPCILSGMIGSCEGWYDAGYVNCPTDLSTLAQSTKIFCEQRKKFFILPGLSLSKPMTALSGTTQTVEVMRGEETQILGAMKDVAEFDTVFCLPGTHSKWVEMHGASVMKFSTYMTGDAFESLSTHTILSKSINDMRVHDVTYFEYGVKQARDGGHILRQIFNVRVSDLFNYIPQSGLASYLSGLLIGHEIVSGIHDMSSENYMVIGSPELSRLYKGAFQTLGYDVVCLDGEACAAAGLWACAETLKNR